MSEELLLRNSQIENTLPPKSERNAGLSENAGELIKQEQLTKNKVKLNMLEAMLEHSKKQLNGTENEEVQRKMNLVEEREYLRATVDPSTYFKGLFKQLQENHPNMPTSTQKIATLNAKIEEKILNGTVIIGPRIIPPKKEELNGMIRSKFLNGSTPQLVNNSRIIHSGLHRSVDDSSVDKSSISERTYDPKLLLKKYKIDTEQMKQQMAEQRKIIQQKLLLEEQQQQEKKQEEKKAYHDQVVKDYEEQRLLQQQREEIAKKNHIEFLQFQKQYKEKKPLYQILEEDYKQKQEIEVQQDKLAKLRELYKPHKPEDFIQHYQKYKQNKRIRLHSETERLEKKRNDFKTSLSMQGQPQLWRGKVHEYVEDEISNQRLVSASQDRKARYERQKNYGDMVKLNYVPKIDEDKQKEINSRNSEFSMPKSIIQKLLLKQEIAAEPNSYKIGLDYMEFAKKLVREHAKHSDDTTVKSQMLGIENSKRQQQSQEVQVDMKSTASNPNTISSNSSKNLYKNYMREERVKNQLKRDDPKKEWENNMVKFEGIERVEKVLQEAQKLDLQAMRKEKIIKYNKPHGRSTDLSDLDDCYFNSIKAKIAILKGVSDY